MVHTQSQHIFLALAAMAVVAGPLCGTAVAVHGGGKDINVTVDGSIRSSLVEEVAVPVETPLPLGSIGHDVSFNVRTNAMVLPNPVGTAYYLLPAAAREVAPAEVNHEGVAMDIAGLAFVVPWYYMMDESSMRPYEALFWDTGTQWYVDLVDQAWSAYAPEGTPAQPVGRATFLAPDVWLRTAVHEIDLLASVDVLLQNEVAATSAGGFDRPEAPAAREALAFLGADLASAASGLAGADGLDAVIADGSAGSAFAPPGPLTAAHAASPSPLAAVVTLEAAALGAAGLLAGLAGYHLIRKNAILKNKVRGSIAEHVLRQPGSTITEIAQSVGVTHQTASYHLRLLQEHGLVIGVERGNKRLYFRNDGSFNQEERGLVAVLRDPESMRVLELIRQNPWIMKNEAAAALGVSRNTLNWHLQKLLSAGLVSEARENGHCFLFCNRKAAGETLTGVVAKVEERKAIGVPPAGSMNGGAAAGMPAVVFQAPAPVAPAPVAAERDGVSGA